MLYRRAHIASIGYELPPNVVTTDDLERRLEPVYRALGLPPGQIEPLTGVRERRQWDPGTPMHEGASRAGRKALERAGVDPADIGMVIYGGVCRDQMEPATACAVADALGVRGAAQVYDLSNACLGVMNGIVHVANAIEVGQVRAGLVVSCESSREIIDLSIEKMRRALGDMNAFRLSLATMTGGSGAVGVVVTDGATGTPFLGDPHRIVGGAWRTDCRHHRLCRWGPDTGVSPTSPMRMETDAPAVLQHGVALGIETWREFRGEIGWPADAPFKTICHQVGTGHRIAILKSIGVAPENDFSTVEFLGNIGTVSLPITAAIAEERGFLEPGDRVCFLGIGSGLNCMMLALEW